MIIITSPAKTLDEISPYPSVEISDPLFPQRTQKIVDFLRAKTPQQLQSILKSSQKIAHLNFDRLQHWSESITRPCLFAYKGDVFKQLQLDQYDDRCLQYANHQLHIISGMYGILRAFDVIRPYRLEMVSKMVGFEETDLVRYWQKEVIGYINQRSDKALLNLASNEYSRVLMHPNLVKPVVSVNFHIYKDGKYKTVGIIAKRARGLMIDWLIQNQISDVSQVKRFDRGGWKLYSESEQFFDFCQ